eukprot:GHVU01201067.1.p1 GENE.GHVU01201067.1~~GHVU01201067.1.p1  ORF type:complete len:160 (+),score=26.41 GHVU01201067.1:119-598(+)
MVQRVTFRRGTTYRTKSNRVKHVRTPGGDLRYQYLKKKPSPPRCGDCKGLIRGVVCVRPCRLAGVAKIHETSSLAITKSRSNQLTVSRAYGGSRCHKCVRNRIVRAFLVEESKCVATVLKEKAKKDKAGPGATKAPKAKAGTKAGGKKTKEGAKAGGKK